MRYLPIAKVQEGMILGRTVYDAMGSVLLYTGTILYDRYIDRLQELGYPALYIRAPYECESPAFLEPVREETIHQAKMVLREISQECQAGRLTPAIFRRVSFVVNQLIDELISNKDLVLNMLEIRSYDSYTFNHSVSTAILSIMAGITLGFDRSRLQDLGIGALLHDLGKIFIPPQILNKPGGLSQEELETVRSHTTRGYHILRDQVSLLSAHVAYQHHERCDGTGYPRGLKKEEITQFAKIVAVSDSYDAMTSGRVYSRAMYPDEVAPILLQEAKDRYDLESVKAVLRNVAPYPIGSVVMLDSGETGEVVDATYNDTTILVNHGSRRGVLVKAPREAAILHRVDWGKWN